MNDRINTAVRGAAAGALATVPMSAVMLGSERLGLMGRQPPEAITRKALDAANQEPDERTVKATAAVAHIAFGAAAGVAFALMHDEDDLPSRAIAKGVGFGLAVYGVSYAGWIPALDILPPPDRDRPGRQPSMALAHVVYGAALGWLLSKR